MSDISGSTPRQRRFVQLIVAAGLVGAVVMSLAMTNTLSAFVATITNSNDTAASGTLILQETGANATCNSTDGTNNTISNNSFSCATINKYGGSTTMVPSNGPNSAPTNTQVTTVNFRNTGTGTAATFTMAFGACTQSNNGSPNGSATDFCSKLRVKVTSGSTTVADNSATALAGTSFPLTVPAAGGAAVPFTFTTYIDQSAGNTYQGLAASQPITWTLSS